MRKKAEAKFARARPPRASKLASQELLHELQVHQIELEMQNEELRRTQLELEMSRDRFVNLYDFAPVGYLTLSRGGVIREANLLGASLLGLERENLKGRRLSAFICSGSTDSWHRFFAHLVEKKSDRSSCNLLLRRADGPEFDAQLVCHRLGDGGAAPDIRIAITDVTAARVAADALHTSIGEKDVLVAELRKALQEVKKLSGLLPFCMYCKKIRDSQGYWKEVERYISSHTDARFSHGVCDKCYAEAERRMG